MREEQEISKPAQVSKDSIVRAKHLLPTDYLPADLSEIVNRLVKRDIMFNSRLSLGKKH